MPYSQRFVVDYVDSDWLSLTKTEMYFDLIFASWISSLLYPPLLLFYYDLNRKEQPF